MKFFIVRHGETVWNKEGRFQGQIDTELNKTGLLQADKLADRLAGHKFSRMISSPLKRAYVTAEKIADACGGISVETAAPLIEINHGSWEGRLAAEIQSEWADIFSAWHDAPEKVTMPGDGGESLNDVLKRSAAFTNNAASNADDDADILLASHDAVIKVLLCHWLDAPLSSFWRFQIPNCSISVVEIQRNKKPRLLLMGDAAHIGDPFNRPEQKGL
ncbi:MAG: histidine phosphatase family protein [Synergistaceae bacterium]|nr:histidine phosphatase family protein [Synergistaceae bacterium]